MKRKNILIWLWSLVILVIFWIGFSIYHNYVTSTISQDIQQDIIQIQPTFNTNALEKLKDRHPVAASYTFASSSAAVTPTIPITPTPGIVLQTTQATPAGKPL